MRNRTWGLFPTKVPEDFVGKFPALFLGNMLPKHQYHVKVTNRKNMFQRNKKWKYFSYRLLSLSSASWMPSRPQNRSTISSLSCQTPSSSAEVSRSCDFHVSAFECFWLAEMIPAVKYGHVTVTWYWGRITCDHVTSSPSRGLWCIIGADASPSADLQGWSHHQPTEATGMAPLHLCCYDNIN